MRHRKHTSKLNRTSEHRAALLRNLAIALLEHERIRTTKVKADQLRPFLEGLVTIAKANTLAARRLVVSRLQDRWAAVKLFDELVPRLAERQSGYLRIVKDGPRMGDGAPMAYIEFVDQRPAASETAAPERKTLKQRLHQRRKELKKARASMA
jgi:large subunit ribosomal protein L17